MKHAFKKMKMLFKRISLATWIFVGFFVGLFIGVFAPSFVFVVKPFETLFLHGIKCVIAPLIFATIVTGIASSGSFKQIGIMGLRALVYFEILTALALIVGLVVVNLVRPGVGFQMGGAKFSPALIHAAGKMTFTDFIEHLIPINFADAMVRGDVLQIVIFSTFFAFGVLAVGERAKPVLKFCEALAEVMFKFISYVMYLAPFGVCAALASAVSENGWQVMVPLLKLVSTLYFALAIFIIGVLWPVCKIFKIPVAGFIQAVKQPVLYAFATTSSESAYPLALVNLQKFGVPKSVVSFVLPMGYSFNLDGSTLYLSLASVFVAQVAGVHLSLTQQVLIALTLMLTSKGVAAVPRTSIIILSGTLTAFQIPIDGLALILGVDAFMDMGRSAVNLLGNCLASAVIARCEGASLGQKNPAEDTGSSDKKMLFDSDKKSGQFSSSKTEQKFSLKTVGKENISKVESYTEKNLEICQNSRNISTFSDNALSGLAIK